MDAARRVAEMGKALVIASGGNQIVNMCRLITLGADVNYVLRFMHEGKEMSTTPLIQTAIDGRVDAARVLISRGAEVNKGNPCNGRTALHVAAGEGHVPVIELLLSNEARIDARTKLGQTPLHQAAFNGHKKAALCLLDHGADINPKDHESFTPLIFAVQEGHLPVVELLILHGAWCYLNVGIEWGYTPLIMAAKEGHLPVVDLLILQGADLNQANNNGATPLSLAADNGHLEIVKLLAEKGAVVDQPCNNGDTALGQASLGGDLGVVDFLLSAGADINHLDTTRTSALYGAAQEGHLSVVKLLVKRGADINQASLHGVSPLHSAALRGHKEVVDYLMSRGAKLEATGAVTATACKCCGGTGVPLKVCDRCQTVYYYSPECQKKDRSEGVKTGTRSNALGWSRSGHSIWKRPRRRSRRRWPGLDCQEAIQGKQGQARLLSPNYIKTTRSH